MTGHKVRCRDCKIYSGERCEIKMKYMNPDTPRYCISFQAKDQESLEAWQHAGHFWPP